MSSEESEEYPSLSKVFDEQLDKYYVIENSRLPSNSHDFQIQVSDCVSKLEELTIHVSQIGVFSTNERLTELPTSSIKFILLPVLLGSLTLKQTGLSPRNEILKIASIYFKDFLNRCQEYEISNIKIPNEDEKETSKGYSIMSKACLPNEGIPSPKELQNMANQRNEKIRKYKEAKATAEKLKELKKALENPSHDEEVLRDYYLTMIHQFVNTSLNDLEAISMEQTMLSHAKEIDNDKDIDYKCQTQIPLKFNLYQLIHEDKLSVSSRPFLITKDAVQKKVFGAGYPSLPVLSIDEFYEQRVNEEWFIAKSEAEAQSSGSGPTNGSKLEKKDSDEETDEDVEKLRHRDEWRDDHKRGWGNTYNRS